VRLKKVDKIETHAMRLYIYFGFEEMMSSLKSSGFSNDGFRLQT